jgi:membrane protein
MLNPNTLPPDTGMESSLPKHASGVTAQRASYRQIVRETFAEWSEDRVPRLGAALAFYAFFSIGPLLYLAVFIAATLYGSAVGDEQQARLEFNQQLANYVGPHAAGTIEDLMQNARRSRSGLVGTLISLVGLLFAGTGAVVALKDALNTIWGVTQPPGASWLATARDRGLSLVVVAVVGTLLIVSLGLSTFLFSAAGKVRELLPLHPPIAVAHVVNYAVSFVVVMMLFAVLFKLLPDVRIAWRDVMIGSAITAVLFLIGKGLFEVYVSHVAVGSTYGSAGALAILLLFAYYSAQVFLLGGEFTQVYAREIGSRIEPRRGAVRITEAALEQRSAQRKLERQEAAQRRRGSSTMPMQRTPEVVETSLPPDRRPPSGTLMRWAMLALALGIGWLGSRGKKTR